MDIDWTHELVEQFDWHWTHHLQPRLVGLTDEEYLWEPVPAAWSVRPRLEATIAWRMGHISIGIFGMRAANHFGDGGVGYESTRWPLDAAGGLAVLERSYRAWLDGIKALDLDALGRPVGPHEGPFAEYPFAALILHINREAIHHGAEICLLRDLYAHRTGGIR
jgi:DinB superfamily